MMMTSKKQNIKGDAHRRAPDFESRDFLKIGFGIPRYNEREPQSLNVIWPTYGLLEKCHKDGDIQRLSNLFTFCPWMSSYGALIQNNPQNYALCVLSRKKFV